MCEDEYVGKYEYVGKDVHNCGYDSKYLCVCEYVYMSLGMQVVFCVCLGMGMCICIHCEYDI